jgi:hypothetical protein
MWIWYVVSFVVGLALGFLLFFRRYPCEPVVIGLAGNLPKIYDFGAFGKWDKRTLLAQCSSTWSRFNYGNEFDFYKMNNEGFIYFYIFPEHIKSMKANVEKEIIKLSKLKILKLTVAELTELQADIDKQKKVLADYKLMVEEMRKTD